MKHLQGNLTISRIQNNLEPHDLMRIDLHDVNSGVLVTSVEISMYDFAMAITGLARVPCEFDMRPNYDIIGRTVQFKVEVIPMQVSDVTFNTVMKYAGLVEIDGWKCSLGENERIIQTEKDGIHYVSVPFKRYVEQKEGEQS